MLPKGYLARDLVKIDLEYPNFAVVCCENADHYNSTPVLDESSTGGELVAPVPSTAPGNQRLKPALDSSSTGQALVSQLKYQPA